MLLQVKVTKNRHAACGWTPEDEFEYEQWKNEKAKIDPVYAAELKYRREQYYECMKWIPGTGWNQK